jgi:hypothetical protein
LMFLCIRSAKLRLENGPIINEGRWIQSWWVLLYFVPLLFRRTTTSSWVELDGCFASSTGGYGHNSSFQVFLMAVLSVLLIQIYSRLLPEKK